MIVILGANHPLGQSIALSFADKGARVVVIDGDAQALDAICDQNPGWIEAMPVQNIETDLRGLLKDAWTAEQIGLVVNLLPLTQPRDISAQMRSLTSVLHATLRGLVKGQGTLVNVVARAADPLAFVAHGMSASVAEATDALSQAVIGKGVRAHCLTLPADGGAPVLETLKHLTTPAGRSLTVTTLHLKATARS